MQPRGGMCVQSNGKIRCEFAESFVLYIVSEKHRPRELGRGLGLEDGFALSVREGKPVRPERTGAAATAAAVFSVAQQRQTPRGKLDADLVRAPRFEPDVHKAQSILPS